MPPANEEDAMANKSKITKKFLFILVYFFNCDAKIKLNMNTQNFLPDFQAFIKLSNNFPEKSRKRSVASRYSLRCHWPAASMTREAPMTSDAQLMTRS